MPVENVFNLAYLGEMFFGPDNQLQGQPTPTFLYDTSFKGVAVTTTLCASCATKYYNPNITGINAGPAMNMTI